MIRKIQMEQAIRDYLIEVASIYARSKGLALTTVSRRFHGTEYFMADFERGKCTVTLRKLDEMLAAFSEAWPESTRWPAAPNGLCHPPAKRKKASANW